MSELDIRNTWINSICQAVLGKSLELINDNDEQVLYENLRDMVNELDNLCILVESDVNLEDEEVIKFELTSLMTGLQKYTLRFPKNKIKEIEIIKKEITNKLSSDRTTNIALLLDLLQNELNGK